MNRPQSKRMMSPQAAVEQALERAAHVLPAQNPLDRFVHHNPLHAWEEQSFDEGVREAAALYGNEPYWSLDAYRDAFRSGRIQPGDLAAVLAELDDHDIAGITTRHALVRALMRHDIEPLTGSPLAWRLTETDALTAPRQDLERDALSRLVACSGGDAERAVQRLWHAVEALGDALPEGVQRQDEPGPRVRDEVLARTGRDLDRLVNPLLIRWSAGYLDHGIAYWPMGEREAGFFQAFLDHFSGPLDLGRPWLREARRLVKRARSESWTAEQTVLHCLERAGYPLGRYEEVVLQSLLALRGWSGMFQRLADRPDTAPEHLGLHTALMDVLAVRLLLDTSAATWLLGDAPLHPAAEKLPHEAEGQVPDPVWHFFQLCQILGISGDQLHQLPREAALALAREARDVPELTLRRLWHEAYERRFRVDTLDAIGSHARRASEAPATSPDVQVSFCIDDREESIRRLLEEVAPWAETLGVAGNYGISMYYQGLQHGHPVALGPAGFEPRHLVVEKQRSGTFQRSRSLGLLRHNLDVGSQTLLRGSMVAIAGITSVVPLTMRLLAPKLHAQLTERDLPTETELLLERTDEGCDAHGLLPGFTVDEMVDIVHTTLRMMSLLRDFAPLVVSLGHGSSSMNNPHEAAHDCGACGGGRGGPNARAFAQMANDPRVRAALRERGVDIPDGTWFVGGYHNTADDAVDLYDLDLVPPAHVDALSRIRTALDEASALDALERTRKFESVSLDATPAEALEHVRNRVQDLAQPRPEYGHCTNAICLVGRRKWSKGLFLDRRAFLCSYDPAVDEDDQLLGELLAMAVPVGAGISLEYWFSVIDPEGYGSGTKLPHNITGLIGVMNGHQSDLRTGLPWQMVELHEPVRLLCVVEATTESLLRVAERNPVVARLVGGGWVQLASLDPDTGEMSFFHDGGFHPWQPERRQLPTAPSSRAWFGNARGLLPPASIVPEEAR